MKKKLEADEADAVRGDIHRRVEMWAFGKELLHMILTLDQISSNDALKKCQLMVVQSPDDDTVRKAYRCGLEPLLCCADTYLCLTCIFWMLLQEYYSSRSPRQTPWRYDSGAAGGEGAVYCAEPSL